MIGVYNLLFINIICIFTKADARNSLLMNILENDGYPNLVFRNTHSMETEIDEQTETVDLKLYYESLCPGCRQFEQTEFKDVVNVLSPYLNINTYPYGNAQTIETNGEIKFECQHGPAECYGNMLHACSLKHNSNHTQALLFNICMMEGNDNSPGSDDAAAARCASEMNVDKDAIIQCANGKEGIQLLKYSGEESKKIYHKYVPYVLINGVEHELKRPLMQDVCAAFKNPPAVCQN